MNKVVFLNGPPKCGKDTITGELQNRFENIFNTKMSLPIKESVHAAIGLPGVDTEYFSARKDRTCVEFFDQIPREVYIDFSENFMKKRFGSDIFGKLWVRKYQNQLTLPANQIFIISDVGFRYEIEPIIRFAGVKNCALIRITKEQCDFGNDSRSYIDADAFNYYANVENKHNNLSYAVEEIINFLTEIGFIPYI